MGREWEQGEIKKLLSVEVEKVEVGNSPPLWKALVSSYSNVPCSALRSNGSWFSAIVTCCCQGDKEEGIRQRKKENFWEWEWDFFPHGNGITTVAELAAEPRTQVPRHRLPRTNQAQPQPGAISCWASGQGSVPLGKDRGLQSAAQLPRLPAFPHKPPALFSPAGSYAELPGTEPLAIYTANI